MKISGIVTLYYPDDEVKDNINSYLDALDKLYVIDNTPNVSNEKNFNFNSKIVYLPQYKNMGVSWALNKGAKLSIKDGYKWMLTMDQDSKFNCDSIKKLIDYLKTSSTENIGLICPWHNIKTGAKKPKKRIEEMIEVMTSGNIINLDAYLKIGGYKDWLFIDGIDFDYCMNLNVNNYKVLRLNYITMEHELGDVKIHKILGRNFVCSNHSYIRRYYMSRNNRYIYDMYHDYFPDYCEMIVKGLNGAMRNILAFEKDKIRKIKYMRKGYSDYKKGIKGELNIEKKKRF